MLKDILVDFPNLTAIHWFLGVPPQKKAQQKRQNKSPPRTGEKHLFEHLLCINKT